MGGVMSRNHESRVIHRLKPGIARGRWGGSGWKRGRAAELDLAQSASVPGGRCLATTGTRRWLHRESDRVPTAFRCVAALVSRGLRDLHRKPLAGREAVG